ncbi:hypothetical protein [Microcoleus sp. B3-D7]|uniref:hypothetical protein n=1 Tax=Microcoleus sp. B3-D7 TaxID=2818659 RepID=UPI002FD23C5B
MKLKRYVAIGLLLLATGCVQKNGRPVSQEEFGQQWPLTVPRGTLLCVQRTFEAPSVIFISPDNKKYALSGGAEISGGYLQIYSILKPAPPNSYYKVVDTGILIMEGYRLCKQ